MTAPLGVLLMAYGSPSSLDEVEGYLTHIRGGHMPPPASVEELRERYRRIGGRSPLLEITRRQARGVQAGLDRLRVPARVYVGMKHAPPFIADTVGEMARDEIRVALGLALAPHYSRMSVGTYISTAADAAERHGISLKCIDSWHDHPGFVRALAARVKEAQARLGDAHAVPVVFTAHSLPQRILEWGDPYPEQLRQTCEGVADGAELGRWLFAYQSASRTDEPWLGPSVAEVLQKLHQNGDRITIVCPVGFVADHLEVLHDIDIEAQEQAATLGMRLERAPSLNDGPDFLAALVDLLRAHAPREMLT